MMDAKAYSPFGPQELAPRPANDNRPQTSMVERVARALAFVDGHGDFLPGSQATSWHEPARAAIDTVADAIYELAEERRVTGQPGDDYIAGVADRLRLSTIQEARQ